jgi:hypothetical protein
MVGRLWVVMEKASWGKKLLLGRMAAMGVVCLDFPSIKNVPFSSWECSYLAASRRWALTVTLTLYHCADGGANTGRKRRRRR